MHATLDIGLGGVGWGMLTLFASWIGCARYVRHRVGWGGVGHDVGCKLDRVHATLGHGVGHVDVGCKLDRMCTLR